MQWYIAQPDGSTTGPCAENDLRSWIEQGHYPPTVLVWREGMSEWQQACSAIPSLPPPLPTVTTMDKGLPQPGGNASTDKTVFQFLGMRIHPEASKEVLFSAAALLIGFFLPWFQLLGFGVSGYQLASLGSYGNYAWLVPILALLVILQSFSADNVRLGAIAGMVPLGAIIYGLMGIDSKAGNSAVQGVFELAKQFFSIGAYVTIVSSLGLILAAFRHPRRIFSFWLHP